MGTAVVLVIVVVCVILAVKSIIKGKKSGKGCHGDCTRCGGCH